MGTGRPRVSISGTSAAHTHYLSIEESPFRARALYRRAENAAAERNARCGDRGSDRGTAETYFQHLAQDADETAGFRAAHGHSRGARAGRQHWRLLRGAGCVHSLWQFIAGEFDDYIATPKGNRYRSIHTAVIGPGGEPVEIQIRTHEMHASSERGVAAHWRYKEGGRGNQAYERKIDELRTLLAPSEDGGGSPDFLDRVRADLFQDRVYVISPKGEIVDVPVGGTPLDFAYQVHTDL